MKNKAFDVPILFIIFRRRDTALKVLEQIGKVRPEKLYISQDGPRNPDEALEVKSIMDAVLSKINWKCKLTVWTHDRNLGLKKHIPEAFGKFFKNEDLGIYLEDDTLPSEDFFYYERELLQMYKDDERVFSINATNFYPEAVKSKDSYYLSKIGDIWGFGLWKRSWRLYKAGIKDFSSVSETDGYDRFFFSLKHRYYLETFWKAIINKKLDSWAFQYVYAALKNNMFFIAPSVNMVNNIGKNSTGSNISLQEYHKKYGDPFPLKHPKNLEYNREYDTSYFDNMLKGGWLRLILIRVYLALPSKLKLEINKLTSKIY
jgi:hypothetical protein